jgi:hypothetical protein
MNDADYSVVDLTGGTDDGIVVVVVVPEVGPRAAFAHRGVCVMARTTVSLRLRERLGHEASEDLADAVEEAKREMLIVAQEKFEARLSVALADLRVTMAEGFANLRREMAEMRVEMSEMRSDTIKWSFLFWIGQVAVIIAALSYMLRPLAR